MFSFEMAATAQARIDEEITRLSAILSSLRTQKNTFAPISRLPPPILARIFVYYAHDDHRRFLHTYVYYPVSMMSCWVGVSYVCRHWRHVALTCPALWSHLFIVSSWWTETLLTRSLDMPLRMCVKPDPSRVNVALGFVAQVAMHVERLEECYLEFELRQSEVAHALSVLSSVRAAPALRILKINIERARRSDWSSDRGQVQVVGDHVLFNGVTPMLRELDLTNYGMPWCSLTLDGLARLRLRNLAPSVQLTVAELKVVLRRMPDLVELHLENALCSGPPSPPCQDSEKVRLPSLARLSICAPLSEVVSILSYVEIPLTTQVRLQCYQETRPSADDLILLCSLLSQWLDAFTRTTTRFFPTCEIAIENLNVGWTNEMHFVFSASKSGCNYNTAEGISIENSSSNIPLVVDVMPWPPLNERNDDMVVHICQMVPLVHLRCITLRNCRFSSTFWEDNFWHLQELRVIRLIDRGLSDLLVTLSLPARPPLPNTEGPEGRGPRQVFAPALKSLELEGVGFSDHWDGKDDVCPDKAGELYRALKKRKREAGRALERLELIDCWHWDEDDVEGLVGVVDVVDWDGRVHDGITG